MCIVSHHKPRIAKDQHPTCKTSDMLHSDIVTNGILHRKRDNFTFLGRVRSMKECLGLCCTFKKCELAYLVNNTKCFSTQCEDFAHCKIEKDKKKNPPKDIQMSLMVRNDENQKGTSQCSKNRPLPYILCPCTEDMSIEDLIMIISVVYNLSINTGVPKLIYQYL